MKLKRLMLITLVLLAILTIGAASAADDVASDDLAVDEEGDSIETLMDEVQEDEVLTSPYSENGFDPLVKDEINLDSEDIVVDINTPDEGNFSITVSDGELLYDVNHEVNDVDRNRGVVQWNLNDLSIAEEGIYFLNAKFIFPSGVEQTIFENHKLEVTGGNEEDEYYLYVNEEELDLTNIEENPDFAGIILPEGTTGTFIIGLLNEDDEVVDELFLSEIPESVDDDPHWFIDDEDGNLHGAFYLKDFDLDMFSDGDALKFYFVNADDDEEFAKFADVLKTESTIQFIVRDDEDEEGDDAADGVIIYVPDGDEIEYDLEDEEDLDAHFAYVSVRNGLDGRIAIMVWSEEEEEEQQLFSFDLEDITDYEDDDENEGFTVYMLSLNDLGNYEDLLDYDSFKLAFFNGEDEEIDSRSYSIDFDENVLKFWEDDEDEEGDDADDGVIIYVPDGDEIEYDLEDEEYLDTPFAYVSVRNDLGGRIAIMVWSEEEEEEQQLFSFDLDDIIDTQDDDENEGFTVYMLSLNDLGNYEDLLDYDSFKLAFFNDEDEEIDSRSYIIDFDENVLKFWEDDEDDDEGPHGEGDEIDAVFTSANILDNGVVVTIPKENVPEDVDNEFTAVILQEDDEPIEITFFLDEILEGDNYIIRVNDLQLPEFKENYDLFMFLQFYSDGEKAYYAEYWDDEFGIHIYESPCIFEETSIFSDDDVITIQEIPEGVDEFTITISKEDSDDIVNTFKFSEMDIDDEEPWVSFKLADLGITEAGDYEITVKYSDELIYTGNLNVNREIDIRTHEEDEEEGGLKTFTSVDELVANLRISESVTGYVKLYVDGTLVGGNIDFADLPVGVVPPEDGRQIILNRFNIDESGEYLIKLEVYSDSDELLGEKEFNILVELSGENNVFIDEGSHPYGAEDLFEFTIGAPLSDGQYFNIYFNDVIAGKYTVDNGLEIFDDFTNEVFDAKLIKPGDYEVRVTFFDGEDETDVTTGSFSINELTLRTDKEVYFIGADVAWISFDMDNVEDDARLWAYYVFNWGPVGRDDQMIFNPYDGKEMKEDGLYEDGVVSFYDDNLELGTNWIYVVYEINEEGESLGGLISFTVVETPEPVDPELTIAPIADVVEGSDIAISVSAIETFDGFVTVFVGDEEVGTFDMVAGEGSFVIGAGNFTVGENTVKVISGESDDFLAGEDRATFTVKPAPVDPGLSIAPIADVVEGSDIAISVSANETFDGFVTVFVGDIEVGTFDMVAGEGSFVIGAGNFTVGENTVKVISGESDDFLAGEDSTTFTVNAKPVPVLIDPALTITIADITEGENAVIQITTNVTFSGDVLVKLGTSNYTVSVVNGTGSVPVAGLAVGTYNATAIFKATDVFSASEKNTTFAVKAKVATAISAAAVTTTYATSKNIVVTLKDVNGNVLAGKNVTVVLNGVTKTLTTNDKGQVSYAIGTKLAPKKYDATIKFAGDSAYAASSATVKVTVNKAKSKMTAKKKTFKAKKKTKKYSIVLKTDKNKALAKAKVTIKIKGKKYTAKTNSKGKATFKIKKLTKKGKYKATVTFAGNKYYNKVTKKVKITVKK